MHQQICPFVSWTFFAQKIYAFNKNSCYKNHDKNQPCKWKWKRRERVWLSMNIKMHLNLSQQHTVVFCCNFTLVTSIKHINIHINCRSHFVCDMHRCCLSGWCRSFLNFLFLFSKRKMQIRIAWHLLLAYTHKQTPNMKFNVITFFELSSAFSTVSSFSPDMRQFQPSLAHTTPHHIVHTLWYIVQSIIFWLPINYNIDFTPFIFFVKVSVFQNHSTSHLLRLWCSVFGFQLLCDIVGIVASSFHSRFRWPIRVWIAFLSNVVWSCTLT